MAVEQLRSSKHRHVEDVMRFRRQTRGNSVLGTTRWQRLRGGNRDEHSKQGADSWCVPHTQTLLCCGSQIHEAFWVGDVKLRV
jgi:hypothetical protein